MRLDKYLKVSRVIKRRTVANEACDAGRVCINGKVAKASAEVKQGDKVRVSFGSNVTVFEVVSIKESARKDEAGLMYKILEG
ncbi:MAG: RNA-binding S4 domain-containing protein [Clostridiales bacterium]|jgi:ribosomal 50S subunit-recycling heat shock protein|nr:RNA-binding S4 domain-containing protein [Clostridiales bacterium]